jgi:RHS repeat-associated protein
MVRLTQQPRYDILDRFINYHRLTLVALTILLVFIITPGYAFALSDDNSATLEEDSSVTDGSSGVSTTEDTESTASDAVTTESTESVVLSEAPSTTIPSEEPAGTAAATLLGDEPSAYRSYLHGDTTPKAEPLNSRGFYVTDLFTGSANYRYSLIIPPGTNGLTPVIELSYSSSGVRGIPGWLGLGWEVTQNYIQRDVNYTPENLTDDKFRLVLNGQSYDLVYVASDGRFHTKVESYLYIANVSGGLNAKGMYWKVLTKDGMEYRFGYSSNSEALASVRDYAWRWSLDQVLDTHGNSIQYNYSENPSAGDIGAVYLSRITYNNDSKRAVEFVLENSDRPDAIMVYDQGSLVKQTRRLKEISITADNTLVRRYAFNYTMSQSTWKSLLKSITEYGSDNTTTPPPEFFTYQNATVGWVNSSAILELPDYSFFGNETEPYLDDRSNGVRLFDADGAGMADVLKYLRYRGLHYTGAWMNNGSGWGANDGRWTPPSVFTDEDSPDYFVDTGFEFDDLNGDGLTDMIQGSYYIGKSAYTNNGSGWGGNNTWQLPTGEYFSGNQSEDTGLRMVDVNGDGLVDLIRYGGIKDGKGAWLNNGSNWGGNNTMWIPPTQIAYWKYPLGPSYDMGVRFADVNGDGLTDILKALYKSGVSTKETWLNNGSGWTRNDTWNLPQDYYFIYEILDMGIRLGDVNGDGLVDLMIGNGDANDGVFLNNGSGWGSKQSNLTWKIPKSFDNSGRDNGLRISDIDGDNMPDFIYRLKYGINGSWIRNSTTPDLLIKVNNSIGGVIKINYTRSAKYNNTRENNMPGLPFIMDVVASIENINGMPSPQNTASTIRFNYSRGYYDFKEKEFRGFNYASITDPEGNLVEHYFHQNDSLKGNEYLTIAYNKSSSLFAKNVNSYSDRLESGVYKVYLNESDGYTYDGSSSNPRITVVKYWYDSYGNVNKTALLGDNSTTLDDRYQLTEYVYNVSNGSWMAGKVKRNALYASDGATKVSETNFTYDNRPYGDVPLKGDLTSVWYWLSGGNSPTVNYSYNRFGNLVNQTDALGHVTQLVYNISDTTFTYPEKIINPLGQETRIKLNLGTGNLLWTVDANGFNTSFEYDTLGRLTKGIRPYDSSSYPTVEYTYYRDGIAPEGMKIASRESAGGSTLDAYTFVDGFARTVQARREAEDSSKEIVINTFYDPLDRPASQSVPHLASKTSNYSSPDLTVLNVSTMYDPLGRVLSVRNTDGTYRNMTYDHWVNNITDENGHVKVFYSDAFGQIIAVEEHNGVEIYNTTYKYDTLGNLLNITDNLNNTFRFEYDSLGRKTGLRDPDLGNWTYGYDAVGNIINQTDARNITVRLTYDNLNRLLKMSYLNDTNVSYAYDVNLNGTLTQVNDSTGSIYYSYDSRLRKTRENRTINGTVYRTSWVYDNMDRVVNMTYPTGEVINFTYNTQGQVDSMANLLYDINYNAFDKITYKSFGNSVKTNYTYRTDNFRLERISTVNSSGGSYMNSSYTYDGVGNIMSIRDSTMAYNRTFGYDSLDRLTAANSTTGYQHVYAYNAIGNMVQWNDSGHSVNYSYGRNAGPHALTAYTTSGSYSCSGSQPPSSGDWTISQSTTCSNSQIVLGNGGNLIFTSYPLTLTHSQVYINGSMILNNNLILSNSSIRYYGAPAASVSGGNVTLVYDRNGNLIQDNQFYYEYNNANNLFIVRQSGAAGAILEEYLYDSNGQRAVKRTYGTVNTIVYYVGGHYEVTQYSNGTTVNTSYYFANGERIAQKDNTGVKYYHSDHLGSSTVMTNSSGSKVDEIEYLPYGSVETGGSSTKYGYNSKELDFTTGLNYYGARYYNPTTMHWTQPDNIVKNPYDPQSLNRYAYVRNNPLRYNDPTGYYAESPLDAFFISLDVYEISQDPDNLWNWGALGADVVCLALPVVTGGGRVVKLVEHGDEVGKAVVKAVEEGEDVGKAVVKGADEVYDTAKNSDALRYFFKNADAVSDISTLGEHAGEVSKFIANYNRGARVKAGVAGVTVLGQGKSAVKKAETIGANCLDFDDVVWDALEKSGKADAVNFQFLDEAIERGDEIIFSSNPFTAVRQFKKEIDYLKEKGYKILEDRAVKGDTT